jgi:hypothetical protein
VWFLGKLSVHGVLGRCKKIPESGMNGDGFVIVGLKTRAHFYKRFFDFVDCNVIFWTEVDSCCAWE